MPATAQVLVKQEVLDRIPEGPVVRDPFVEVEVHVDNLLDHILHLLVEGQADALARVDPGAGVQGRVPVELLHHLAQGQPVLGSQVQAEAFVQLGDDHR